jgi:hypothetical protein
MALGPTGCRIRHARYLWVALMTCDDAFSLGILHDDPLFSYTDYPDYPPGEHAST